MLNTLLGVMAASAYVPPVQPSVTSVTVSLSTGGACKSPRGTGVSPSAIVRATFAIANSNYALFTTKVYKDGALRKTLTAAGTTTDDFTVTGYVAGETGHSFTANYVWRVDIIRNSDNVVVSTRTSATYTNEFGDCSGPV